MVMSPGNLRSWRIPPTLALLLFTLVLGGCSDTTQPDATPGGGTGRFAGLIDPDEESFILQALESPVGGDTPIRVDLLGRNLRMDRLTEQVSLEVAVHNVDWRPLYAPAEIVVSSFDPASTVPINPAWTSCADSTIRPPVPETCAYGFDYSTLLGDDEVLQPGEVSTYREWTFCVPGLEAFSFGAAARFALAPDGARIAGLFFRDSNENGRHDPGEAPFPGGCVEVAGPGIDGRRVPLREDGRYAVPIHEAGLYKLTGVPPPTAGVLPLRFTTPNPLEVVILEGPQGRLQSYLDADFGLVNSLDPGGLPRIRLVEGPADSLLQDPYNLLELALDGDLLILRVGYSGCQPDHPFLLFMVGGFMESMPVQARVILVHNGLDELCDGYFEQTLTYDLRPIQEAHAEAYGGPGIVILQFVDNFGDAHRLEYFP
jgi:hypothetical protein